MDYKARKDRLHYHLGLPNECSREVEQDMLETSVYYAWQRISGVDNRLYIEVVGQNTVRRGLAMSGGRTSTWVRKQAKHMPVEQHVAGQPWTTTGPDRQRRVVTSGHRAKYIGFLGSNRIIAFDQSTLGGRAQKL
jgi:hypothetical protein